MSYQKAKKRGICWLCKGKAAHNRSYCNKCAAARTDAARLERRTRQRKCQACGNDFTGLKRRLCESCAEHTGQHFRDRQRQWRQKLKREVFDAYGGPLCVCCGEKQVLFLSIDHVANNGAVHRRELNPKYGTGGARFYGWLKRNKFPSGYQVLCMNCQWGKKLNGGICPHKGAL